MKKLGLLLGSIFFLGLGTCVLADNEKPKGDWYDADKAVEHAFTIEAGYTYSMSTLHRFNDFLESYNNYFASHLSQSFQMHELGGSPYFGFGYGSRYLSIILNYNRYANHLESRFHSGEGREYDLKMNSYNMEWTFAVPFNFPLTFGITIGGSIDRGTLFSGYRYADGSISYGSEKQLNGLYHIQSTSFNAGFKLIWQTNWGNFFAEIDRYGISLSDTELALRDDQHDSPSLYDNHILTNYHPTDIEVSDDSNVYFIGLHSTIPNKFPGPKFTFGTSYYIGKR